MVEWEVGLLEEQHPIKKKVKTLKPCSLKGLIIIHLHVHVYNCGGPEDPALLHTGKLNMQILIQCKKGNYNNAIIMPTCVDRFLYTTRQWWR